MDLYSKKKILESVPTSSKKRYGKLENSIHKNVHLSVGSLLQMKFKKILVIKKFFLGVT